MPRSLDPRSFLLGLVSCLALVLGASAASGAAAPSQDVPPDVRAGVKLYRVVLTNQEALPGQPPTSPLHVLETRGSWARVEGPSLPNDPYWLNLNEIVRYKTEL